MDPYTGRQCVLTANNTGSGYFGVVRMRRGMSVSTEVEEYTRTEHSVKYSLEPGNRSEVNGEVDRPSKEGTYGISISA